VSDSEPTVSVEEVVARMGDAFFALDREWRFTYLNDRAEDMLERSRDELLGRVFWRRTTRRGRTPPTAG